MSDHAIDPGTPISSRNFSNSILQDFSDIDISSESPNESFFNRNDFRPTDKMLKNIMASTTETTDGTNTTNEPTIHNITNRVKRNKVPPPNNSTTSKNFQKEQGLNTELLTANDGINNSPNGVRQQTSVLFPSPGRSESFPLPSINSIKPDNIDKDTHINPLNKQNPKNQSPSPLPGEHNRSMSSIIGSGIFSHNNSFNINQSETQSDKLPEFKATLNQPTSQELSYSKTSYSPTNPENNNYNHEPASINPSTIINSTSYTGNSFQPDGRPSYGKTYFNEKEYTENFNHGYSDNRILTERGNLGQTNQVNLRLTPTTKSPIGDNRVDQIYSSNSQYNDNILPQLSIRNLLETNSESEALIMGETKKINHNSYNIQQNSRESQENYKENSLREGQENGPQYAPQNIYGSTSEHEDQSISEDISEPISEDSSEYTSDHDSEDISNHNSEDVLENDFEHGPDGNFQEEWSKRVNEEGLERDSESVVEIMEPPPRSAEQSLQSYNPTESLIQNEQIQSNPNLMNPHTSDSEIRAATQKQNKFFIDNSKSDDETAEEIPIALDNDRNQVIINDTQEPPTTNGKYSQRNKEENSQNENLQNKVILHPNPTKTFDVNLPKPSHNILFGGPTPKFIREQKITPDMSINDIPNGKSTRKPNGRGNVQISPQKIVHHYSPHSSPARSKSSLKSTTTTQKQPPKSFLAHHEIPGTPKGFSTTRAFETTRNKPSVAPHSKKTNYDEGFTPEIPHASSTPFSERDSEELSYLSQKKYSDFSSKKRNSQPYDTYSEGVSVEENIPPKPPRFYNDPSVPYTLNLYFQFFLSMVFSGIALYFVYLFITTIQNDVNSKVEEYSTDILSEIAECSKQYLRNNCMPGRRVPALETICTSWEKCMNRDPKIVGKTRISAETFSEVIDSFIKRLSAKTWCVFFGAIIICLVIIPSSMFSSFRTSSQMKSNNPPYHNYPGPHPGGQYQAPYPQPPPPPPDQGYYAISSYPMNVYATPMPSTTPMIHTAGMTPMMPQFSAMASRRKFALSPSESRKHRFHKQVG